jgi:hypothetical protein
MSGFAGDRGLAPPSTAPIRLQIADHAGIGTVALQIVHDPVSAIRAAPSSEALSAAVTLIALSAAYGDAERRCRCPLRRSRPGRTIRA